MKRNEVDMKRHHVSGQGMAEYGLILALVAIVVAVALGTFGGTVSTAYSNIVAAMP